MDNNDADLIISGTVNTRKISDIPNKIAGVEIYQVSGNATITVSNGLTGDEIVSKTFNIIKIIDYYSFEEAANKALKDISEKITEVFLPELIELIKGM